MICYGILIVFYVLITTTFLQKKLYQHFVQYFAMLFFVAMSKLYYCSGTHLYSLYS